MPPQHDGLRIQRVRVRAVAFHAGDETKRPGRGPPGKPGRVQGSVALSSRCTTRPSTSHHIHLGDQRSVQYGTPLLLNRRRDQTNPRRVTNFTYSQLGPLVHVFGKNWEVNRRPPRLVVRTPRNCSQGHRNIYDCTVNH